MIEPRFGPAGPAGPSRGAVAVNVARAVLGLEPLDWQRYALAHGLAVEPSGRYRYSTVVLTVARQNGKSTIARTLLANALVNDPGSAAGIMSQDRSGTLAVLFRPLVRALRSPALEALGARAWSAQGSERLRLDALGSEVAVLSANETGAHGYSLDLALVDEAWALFDYRVPQAITPTQVARPNPQLWVVSTAGVDQSLWLRSLVDKGRAGTAGLLYLEWSAAAGDDPDDPATWADANPSMGATIRPEALADASTKLPPDEFERAHLNRWTSSVEAIIPAALWAQCASDLAIPLEGMVLGLDVHRDRADAVIVAAAEVAGRLALEVVDQRPGTDWVLGRLLELVERHRPRALVAPAFGQARALLEQAPAQGLALEGVRTPDYVTACQMFYDLTLERRLAHRGQETLDGAVRAAGKRTVAGAWAFGSRGDISPLAAAVVAAWRASRPHIVPRLIVG